MKDFLKEEDGLQVVEMALILLIILLLVFTFKTTIVQYFNLIKGKIVETMEKILE